MFQIKFVKKIKTHILYSVTFSENRAVYEIMSKNVVVLEIPQKNMAPAHGILDK
jgi:hypothetical protein